MPLLHCPEFYARLACAQEQNDGFFDTAWLARKVNRNFLVNKLVTHIFYFIILVYRLSFLTLKNNYKINRQLGREN